MKELRSVFLMLFWLVYWVFLTASLAGQTLESLKDVLPEIEVKGKAWRPDGHVFAILKNVGILGEGDSFAYAARDTRFEVEIAAITDEAILVRVLKRETLKPVVMEVAQIAAPAEAVRPSRPAGPRDPFWPVGYGEWKDE